MENEQPQVKKTLATNFAGHRVPKSAPCEHCQGRRLVFSELLGKSIPCPQCRRKPRQDASGLNAIKANEKRRMERLVARAVAIEIAAALGHHVRTADPVYATTDRIMQRWAVGHGTGLPRTHEEIDQLAKKMQEQHEDVFASEHSLPPTLDDHTQIIVDRIVGVDPRHHYQVSRPITAAPEPIARFVWQWYCSDVPCSVLAQQRGLSHEDVYLEWRAVLQYLRGRFASSGHSDLIALVNGQV